MADRYVAIHESKARTRKLPGYEEPADWHEDNGWALFECDDAGVPVRLVFCDRMEPEDAILVRDLRPLVAELNRLASRAPSPPETPATDWWERGFRAGIDAASREIAPGPYPSCCEAHECETKQAWHRRKNLQIRVEALRTPPASPASAPRETTEEPKTCNFLQRIDALRAIEADSGERVRALEEALRKVMKAKSGAEAYEAARRALSPQGDGPRPVFIPGGAFCGCGQVEFVCPGSAVARTWSPGAKWPMLHRPDGCRLATDEEIRNLDPSTPEGQPQGDGAPGPKTKE